MHTCISTHEAIRTLEYIMRIMETIWKISTVMKYEYIVEIMEYLASREYLNNQLSLY